MHRPAANTAARVVGAKGDGVVSSNDALICPVEFVRAGFVAHPVAFGVPERARFDADNPKPGPCEPLQEHAARRPDADDDEVDLFALGIAPHRRVDGLQGAERMGGGLGPRKWASER